MVELFYHCHLIFVIISLMGWMNKYNFNYDILHVELLQVLPQARPVVRMKKFRQSLKTPVPQPVFQILCVHISKKQLDRG